MRRPTLRFAELRCCSCFSFLEGASPPEDLVARARELGLHALALTDRDGVYAAPRFRAACEEAGLRGVYGAEVTLESGRRLVLLVRDETGWRHLCRILTRGRRAAEKGASRVSFAFVAEHARGLFALSGGRDGEVEQALLHGAEDEAARRAGIYREVFGPRGFFLELHHHLLGIEDRLRGLQCRLADRLGLKVVATNHVRYARPASRRLQDVLTCIRERTELARAGRRLLPNGEYHLKSPEEMATRFRERPDALRTSVEIAERCRFRLVELGYRLPEFPVPDGETPFSYLHALTGEGAKERYRPLSPRAARQLAHELDVIERLGLAGYFLIVWDLIRFCRERGILCQGRGSAANSAVCYALGITSVDPVGLELLFERFLSEERTETPDIDLDIEHERREEVLQYVYQRYGREHAGMVCTFITYRARSAVRDVGKTLGLSEAQVRQATKVLGYERARELADTLEGGGVQLPGLRLEGRRLQFLPSLCREIDGFPRHLSIHTGGMVIAAAPLSEVVPIENAAMEGRTVIQWDKDDVASLGLVKIDLLGLGGLTLVHRAFDLLARHKDLRLDLHRLPPDDSGVYDMMCRADTVGVFQIESRAQMNCLPRLKPRSFYDLVVEVSLIRPGPIQGKMVHPYLRRRQGREPVTYPHPSLRPILERTLGVPLFQEQGMKIAVAAAGFTPSEADELRRAMGHKRSRERMAQLSQRLVDGMARRGIPEEAAQRIFAQLAAFADYGFPESHAASFALIVYATAWLKHHHPEVFAAAILNSQPMGFYAPATLVNDARRHGVEFHSIDVRGSLWDCTLEPRDGNDAADGGWAVRLGLRFVQGLGAGFHERLEAEQARGEFRSPEDFGRRCRVTPRVMETLARLGAFAGFGGTRREALWQVQATTRTPAGPLAARQRPEPKVELPPMSDREVVAEDYRGTGLSLEKQPMELWREELSARGVLAASDLAAVADGRPVLVGGLVICRQRPPTAKGMCFLTLEDETGTTNVVIPPQVEERHRKVVRLAPFVVVRGRLERADGVTNVRAAVLFEIGSEDVTGRFESHDFH